MNERVALVRFIKKQRDDFINDKVRVVELLEGNCYGFDSSYLEHKLQMIEANIVALSNQLEEI